MMLWSYLFGSSVMIPLILIIAGGRMRKGGFKKINSLYGYRTEFSMKNMDTWTFANQYCGQIWWKGGWCLLVPCVLAMILFRKCSETVISFVGIGELMLQFGVIIFSQFRVEDALRRTFNKDGTRK